MVYWAEEDFKEIYDRYQVSGLSIREFCNREGILEGRFHHWKKKLDLKEVTPQFVPMKLNRQTGGLEVTRGIADNPRQLADQKGEAYTYTTFRISRTGTKKIGASICFPDTCPLCS